jgi:hypothetical protein
MLHYEDFTAHLAANIQLLKEVGIVKSQKSHRGGMKY